MIAALVQIDVSGALIETTISDDGTSIDIPFNIPGNSYSASFSYIADASMADFIDDSEGPNDIGYIFNNSLIPATANVGGINYSHNNISIGVGDNLNSSTIDFDSLTFGLLNLVGTFDVLSIVASASQVTVNNGEVELGDVIFTLLFFGDSSSYDSAEILPSTPPANSEILFVLADLDNLRLAAGDIQSISVIPVPAAVWMMATGLLGLFGFKRRLDTH